MTRLTVTDHAVVRYLERVLHIDLDKIREDIQAEIAGGRVIAVPPRGGGVAFLGPRKKSACIVRDEKVVTVLGTREIRGAADWKGIV